MNEHGDLTLEGPYVGGAASQWVAVPPYAYGGVDDPTDDFYKLPPEVHDAYGINDNLQVVAVDSASSRVCVYQLDLGGTFTRTAVLGTNAGMSQGQINSAGVIAHWTPYYYRKNSARAVLARTGTPTRQRNRSPRLRATHRTSTVTLKSAGMQTTCTAVSFSIPRRDFGSWTIWCSRKTTRCGLIR